CSGTGADAGRRRGCRSWWPRRWCASRSAEAPAAGPRDGAFGPRPRLRGLAAKVPSGTEPGGASLVQCGLTLREPDPMDTSRDEIPRLHATFAALRDDLAAEIVGQAELVERLLVALLADGHLLVEGAPGLAKTSAVRALAARIDADFARVQFTPDLLPADLTGTEGWRPQEARFEFVPGPVFHSLLLADEINRAPAKVQSALLEAMGERQVTVGRETYPLPRLFLVMATQNPIEQEGT